MAKNLIYFDNAASTQMFEEVVDLMHKLLRDNYGNPGSMHQVGRSAKVAIEQARRTMAKCINARQGNVYFTSGGTESNNAILFACHFHLGRNNFISSKLEHPSVLQYLYFLKSKMGCGLQFVNHSSDGVLQLDHLAELLQESENSVVSLMHANNETGNLLPLSEVGLLCKKYGALFHSDTIQTAGKMVLDFDVLPVDFASFSAHKFHGPKGIGAIYMRKEIKLNAFVLGGNQERAMRAGTENVQGIAGMAKALELSYSNIETVSANILLIRNFLLEALPREIGGATFAGDVHGDALPSILNVLLPKTMDASVLLPKLDLEGFCLSSGSACASGSNKPSAVLTAMGIEPNLPNLRISIGRFNTMDEAKALVEVLAKIANQV